MARRVALASCRSLVGQCRRTGCQANRTRDRAARRQDYVAGLVLLSGQRALPGAWLAWPFGSALREGTGLPIPHPGFRWAARSNGAPGLSASRAAFRSGSLYLAQSLWRPALSSHHTGSLAHHRSSGAWTDGHCRPALSPGAWAFCPATTSRRGESVDQHDMYSAFRNMDLPDGVGPRLRSGRRLLHSSDALSDQCLCTGHCRSGPGHFC